MAQAIASYEATSSEQLSLQKGQMVLVRKKTDSGWWEGELQVIIVPKVMKHSINGYFLFRLKVEGSKLVGFQLLMLKYYKVDG